MEVGNAAAFCDLDNAEMSATVNVNTQESVEYSILVSRARGKQLHHDDCGSFGLTVQQITPPTNDECTNALSLI
jgi:hypothetical protein